MHPFYPNYKTISDDIFLPMKLSVVGWCYPKLEAAPAVLSDLTKCSYLKDRSMFSHSSAEQMCPSSQASQALNFCRVPSSPPHSITTSGLLSPGSLLQQASCPWAGKSLSSGSKGKHWRRKQMEAFWCL